MYKIMMPKAEKLRESTQKFAKNWICVQNLLKAEKVWESLKWCVKSRESMRKCGK